MRMKLFQKGLIGLVVLGCLAFPAMGQDPIEIYDVYDLQAMQNDLTGHYVLANDIDASETATWNSGAGFVPIGVYSAFIGNFDGQGHTITGLTAGLFGRCVGAHIQNVGLENANVTSTGQVGGLAGEIRYCTITNCYTTGSVTGTRGVGGLVGFVGGYSAITNCYSTSNVSGDVFGSCVGGLVGYFEWYATITNCYATGNVSSNYTVGGLVGDIDDTSPATIINSYYDFQTTGQYNDDFLYGIRGLTIIGTKTYV